LAKRAWRYWDPTFEADQVCELNPVWPWGGHRAFAYDLVRWMRPARVAELGVHWGTSFFAFAQAVKDGRMKETELVGVDTFEGEDHAGHYGPEVLEAVRRIVREHFPGLKITLHKMLFREALAHVADGSIDLLHIDGLHTYDAVKDDFETWLPKLAPEGIMLFHDVAPGTGYGSTDYWKELSALHPSFAFTHSWGLGVLFPKGDARLKELQKVGLEDKIALYGYRETAQRATRELEAAKKLALERMKGIESQGQLIQERNKWIENLKTELEASKKLARERMTSIEGLTARNDELRKASAAMPKLEARAASAEAARAELRKTSEAQEKRLTQALAAREALQTQLAESKERNAKLRETLAHEKGVQAQLRVTIQQLQATQKQLEKRLGDLVEHVAALATSHERDRAEAQRSREAIAAAVEESRKASQAVTGTLAGRLNRLNTDAELLSMRTEYLEEIVSRHRERLDTPEPTQTPENDWLTGETRPATRRSGKKP
jgi:hypothetical protein